MLLLVAMVHIICADVGLRVISGLVVVLGTLALDALLPLTITSSAQRFLSITSAYLTIACSKINTWIMTILLNLNCFKTQN